MFIYEYFNVKKKNVLMNNAFLYLIMSKPVRVLDILNAVTIIIRIMDVEDSVIVVVHIVNMVIESVPIGILRHVFGGKDDSNKEDKQKEEKKAGHGNNRVLGA